MPPRLRLVTKILAGFIIFSHILGISTPGLSYLASAAPASKSPVAQEREPFPSRPTSKVEIRQWREPNARHFLNPDGSFTAEVFKNKIFYQDRQTRVMLPIDNNLKPADQPGYAWANGANRFTALFGATASSASLVRFALDDSAIEFSPVGAGAATGQVQSNAVIYSSAYPGVDLKYEVLADRLKESIILASANSPTAYSFALNLTNLTYRAQPDGSIAFFRKGEAEPLLVFPKPFMYEAGDEPAASQGVTQVIRQEGGRLYLDVTADPAWVKQPGRKFPVIIDPDIVVQPGPAESKDTFASSSEPSTAHNGLAFLIAGNQVTYGTTRSYLWFKLPSLPEGAVINSARYSLNMYLSETDTTTVEAYRVTSDWSSSTLTWNAQPSTASTRETGVAINGPGWWDFYTTSLVTGWYNGDFPNYGVMLKANPETANRRSFRSGDYSNPDEVPKLTINYTVDPIGDQSFWTYTGDGVNPFNGNLVLQAIDLATPGRGVAAAISRAYNSRASDRLGLFGYGWSSNLDMKVKNTAKGPIVFTDATGARHVFENNGDDTYKAPPGISYSVAWNKSNGTYTVTTVDKTVFTFDDWGLLSKITDSNNQVTNFVRDAGRRLTGITDPSGRTTSVSVSAAGLVTSATDPSGRTAVYFYDAANNLYKVEITKGTSSSVVLYGYAAGTHRLTSVTDPKGQVVSFGYDTANNRVTSVSWTLGSNTYSNTYSYPTSLTATVTGPAGLGRSVTYTFNDQGNLLQAGVLTDTGTLTTKYDWDAAHNLLKVTDPKNQSTSISYNDKGQPLTITNHRDLTTSFNYDSAYNPIIGKEARGGVNAANFDSRNNQTEAIDPLGNASLLRYGSVTGNLLSSTLPISLAANLLANPGFEDDTLTYWAATRTPGAGESVGLDTATVSGGYKSLKITSTSTLAVKDTASAPVIPGANYTLTADVKTGSGHAAAMRVHWFKSDGSPSAIEAVTPDLSLTANGVVWRRKGTQVTAPSDAATAQVEVKVNGSGTAWFDNIQFETGAGRWENNVIANPGFDLDVDQSQFADGWYPSERDPAKISIDFSNPRTGAASQKIVGTGVSNYVYRWIDISGEAGNKLAFSGWAKRSVSGSATYFAGLAELYDSNGAFTESFDITFNPTQTAWHQASKVFRATKPFAKIKAYAIHNASSGTAWFDDFEIHKQYLTSAAVSQYNHAENSSFEADWNGTNWPDRWEKVQQSGTTPTFTWEGLTKSYTGDRSASIKAPGGWASILNTRRVPYSSAKTYTATGYFKTEAVSSTAVLLIHCYDSAGNWLGEIASPTVTGDTGWTALSAVLSGGAPAGTAYLRVGVQMRQGSGTAYFDNVRLLEGQKRTAFGYDTNNNYVTNVTNQLGHTVWMNVDPNAGVITRLAKPLGSALDYTYDFLNRLKTAAFSYLGQTKTFTYGYDANGHLETVTAPGGQQPWSFTYNALNKLKTAVEQAGGISYTTTLSYNALGELVKIARPNAAYTDFVVDKAGRVTDAKHGWGANPPSLTFSFGYDSASNLTSFTGPNGQTTLVYDNLNRLTDINEPSGDRTYYGYDPASNVTGTTKVAPDTTTWTVDYKYDERNAMSGVTDVLRAKSSWFRYNESGQLVKSYNQTNTTGYSSFYKYDAAGRLTEVLAQNPANGAEILLRYQYDQNGNVTRIDDDLAQKYVLYTYDELNQLTKEEYWTIGNPSADTTIQYAYDELGNRTSVTRNGVPTTYSYNTEKNRLTAMGGVSYTYVYIGSKG